jgi:hypothetical protein
MFTEEDISSSADFLSPCPPKRVNISLLSTICLELGNYSPFRGMVAKRPGGITNEAKSLSGKCAKNRVNRVLRQQEMPAEELQRFLPAASVFSLSFVSQGVSFSL